MKMKNSVVLSFSSFSSFSSLAFRTCVYMYVYKYYLIICLIYVCDLKRAATHRQNTGVGIDLNTILMV